MAAVIGLTNGNNAKEDGQRIRSHSSSNGIEHSITHHSVINDHHAKHPTDRVKRRAKRPSKLLGASRDETHPNINGYVNKNTTLYRLNKNGRKPRNGVGRGLPKKGGAGGKGTWGKLGSELDPPEEDIHDPNYDSDSQDNLKFEQIIPVLNNEEDFERSMEPLLQEYFEHGDTGEVVLTLEELNISESLKPEIVVLAVTLAMERKPSHREMTSVLLSDLYGCILTLKDVADAFELLLRSLPDLALDTPEAAMVLGNFVARAVADDCLPPKFVQDCRDNPELNNSELLESALQHADVLLKMKHGLVRLDNVWGVGGGMRPVKSLLRQIQLLLKEYLSSGDAEEAARCLQNLEVPHFHHELVYEAVVMALENMKPQSMIQIAEFLGNLAQSNLVTPDQMRAGFQRVYGEMPDIALDVPAAYVLLEKFVLHCNKVGFLSPDLMNSVPSRGRKRFVSEGDGGRIKEDYY